MSRGFAPDEELIRRLPLPQAQLARHAQNAKTPLERTLAAYFLWESALKLLGGTAVVAFAEHPSPDPALAEMLQALARPALGHWWGIARSLVPALAGAGDEGFRAVGEALLGKARDDLPRAAGLDAVLGELLDGAGGARSTVRVRDLFDRLVQFRNRYIGHGAPGQLAPDWYGRLGPALLAGVTELLGRLDVLAGRRLLYLAEVRRLPAGGWRLERYELTGESPRRLDPFDLPESASPLPHPEQLYLEPGASAGLTALHPLLVFDTAGADVSGGEVLFLNARRGQPRTEYLGYRSGRVVERPDLGGERRELLARVLRMPVAEAEAAGWEARSRADDPAIATEEDAPQRLGEFELRGRLGRGGMGVVYRAWQPSLGREVALKCLLGSGDARSESRFGREIRALGRVNHQHLVKIFTSGAAGEQWFYAMELVEGATLAAALAHLQAKAADAGAVDVQTWRETLSTACDEARRAEEPVADSPGGNGPPSPAPPTPAAPASGVGYVQQVVELVRQVADAAHALHEAGIVHRDIKPGNVMVAPDGSHAVLMDLGLAQLTGEGHGKLTRTRQFVGTLRYASPEQVLAAGPVDRRSDVYSLGATLWELLALRPLYDATEETPSPELMRRIQYAEPGRVRRHNRRVPADLEAVVLRCLEKDPRRRYATANELAEDLGRWLRGEPVRARPRTARYVAGKFLRRHRVGLAVLGSVVVLQAVTALTLYHRLTHPAPPPEPQAPPGTAEFGGEVAPPTSAPPGAAVAPPVTPPPGAPELPLSRDAAEADHAAPRPARRLVGGTDVLVAVRAHLTKVPAEGRPHQRYFTLTNAHNSPAVSDADLRLHRAALSKALNSLSWQNKVVIPEAIDPDQTVFAVDLRQLGWDREQVWNALLKEYPYGMTHENDPDDITRELALEVTRLSGSGLPYLRADWFVATATRPPLYHAILSIPPDAQELERRLKVDVRADFLSGRLARAGFSESGVARQNRVVERHESQYGAYWRTFDFPSAGGRGNVARFPLGPEFPDHPFRELAFRHECGNALFTLPNGLLGYMALDGRDRRIEVLPTDVVADTMLTSGTAAIVNGLSCIACHKRGVIAFKDQVRTGSAAADGALKKVEQLYPPDEDLAKLMERDEARFLQALDQACGPFLRVGADAGRDIRDFPEPVSQVAREFIRKPLSLPEVAVELGVPPDELKEAVSSNPEFRKLGLGPLISGGTISREVWQGRSTRLVPSAFQEAAGALGLGTPKSFQ